VKAAQRLAAVPPLPPPPPPPPGVADAAAAVEEAARALATAREKLLTKRAAEAVALTALDADESTQPAYRRAVDLRESAERNVSRKEAELAGARTVLEEAEAERMADELAVAEMRSLDWQEGARPIFESLLAIDREVSALVDRLADLCAANEIATAESETLARKLKATTTARKIALPIVEHTVQVYLSAARRAEGRDRTPVLVDLDEPSWTNTTATSVHEAAQATLQAMGLVTS
jgi:hypothetical protein